MSRAHVVQDLQFEVGFESEEQAFDMQERLSAFAQGPALRIVAQVFDDACGDPDLLHLERLEVDLGVVDPGELEQQWEERLREQLRRVLADRVLAGGTQDASGSAPAVRRIAARQAELEAFLHYLRCGALPWHAAAETDPVELAQRMLQHDLDALVARLRQWPDERNVARRMARQLPEAWCEQLARAVGAPDAPDREASVPGPAARVAAEQQLLRALRLSVAVPAQPDGAGLAQAEPGTSSPAPRDSSVPEPPDEPLFVTNAGIVLLAPYLQRLFGLLGLANDKAFVNVEAAERAIAVIQYAVTGQAAAPETLLPMNKLLCGLSLHAPVPRDVDLERAEREAVDGLLGAVIGHWKALGQTSVAGLRQTFLQREGRLEYKEDGWHLEVPNQTFDMLIDRLPWGFSTIRYPWMPEVLHVHWR